MEVKATEAAAKGVVVKAAVETVVVKAEVKGVA